jgi:serine protease Do
MPRLLFRVGLTTTSLVLLAACGSPKRVSAPTTVSSAPVAVHDCAGAPVAARDLAAFARASDLGSAHLPIAAQALHDLRVSLGTPFPGSGPAHDTYAAERDAVRRESESRLDAMTKISEGLLGPTLAAQSASQRILSPCNSLKKKPWCEQANQLVLGVAWDDERSVSAFARNLEALDKNAKTMEQTANAIATAQALSTALAASREARTAAAAPLAHRARAVDLASAYVTACGPERSTAVAMPRLVVDDRAGMRKLTVVVESRPPKTLSEQFLTAAVYARTREQASLYQSVASGRSGSGAAVVVDNGGARTTYIFTNRHVVDHAETITVAIENGIPAKVEIVRLDPVYDLAVLKVRGTAIAPNGGLGIEDHIAKDGQAVIATGFPGIVGQPSFQTTKGYVSNERFAMRSDNDDVDLFHVQHTAPIDGGSSGGPLTSEAGRLLGINAFKLKDREGAALAVPASALGSALREVLDEKTPPDEERSACLELISSLSPRHSRVDAIRKNLGVKIVAADGIDSYDYLVDRHPNVVKDFDIAPMRTLAEAVAHRIDLEVWRAGGTNMLESCAGKGTTRRIALADGSTREVRFEKEHGRLAIASFEFITTQPPPDPPKAAAPTKTKKAPASAKGKKQ